MTPIRAENNRTQLCLQTELAEEKSQSLQSQKSPRGENKCISMKKKIVTSNGITTCVCRPEIGPKHFDKLKPEPGPTRKVRPDLQLCFEPWVPTFCEINMCLE